MSNPTEDEARAERKRKLLKQWATLANDLADPAVELVAEDVAIIFSVAKQLEENGVELDALLKSLLVCLERQIRFTSDDADMDGFDAYTSEAEDTEDDSANADVSLQLVRTGRGMRIMQEAGAR